jgi:hypothetical protein
MNLSPYSKTVVSAVGTLVAVVIQFAVGDGADAATLGTAIIGLLTTLGVFQVTNTPVAKTSPVQPSVHELLVSDNDPMLGSVIDFPVAPRPVTPKKPRPRPTSKPVAKKRATTKKGTPDAG